MRRLLVLAFGWAALAASPASAADALRMAPAAPWVKTVDIPTGPASPGGALQILLMDRQARFGPDTTEFYEDSAAKVLSAQGLQALGTLGVTWDPLKDTITINKVELIRDGKVIDLLKDGQPFTILHREANMAAAVIDGRLTAVKEIHDLRVGDIIHFTRSRISTKVIAGEKPEYWDMLAPPGIASRVRYRLRWHKGDTMRWRTTEGFGDVTVKDDGDEVELLSDRENVERLIGPEDAPSRFSALGQLELTQFAGWRDVSAVFAPIYAKAAVLTPNSPLRAVADKIRRENATPEAQASAALRIVEQEVRYLALAAGDAGLTPATADETWERRFGDCKGKTVLLIALLGELGIKGEPALAASSGGDGLPERLPRIGAFDHVIVRTEIGGKTYWLDGTRVGDRTIQSAPEPLLDWVLPLRDAGSELEQIAVSAPTRPMTDITIFLDASGGLDVDGPAHIESLLRGYPALAMEQGIGSVSRQDAEKALREQWASSKWFKIDKIDFAYDESLEAYRLRFDGHGKFDWDFDQGLRQEDMNAAFGVSYDARTKGVRRDAPFELTFPEYTVTTIRVRLPDKGEGFQLIGSDAEKTISGIAIKRTSAIANGEATVTMVQRNLVPEIDYKTALTLEKAFAALPTATSVVLRAPRSLSVANKAKAGSARQAAGDKTDKVKAYELINQAQARVQADQPARALELIEQALVLNPDEPYAHRMRLFLLMAQGKKAEAARQARKTASQFKDNADIQIMAAQILVEGSAPAEALKFADEMISAGDAPDGAYIVRAQALVKLGRTSDMLAAQDARLAELGAKESNRLYLGDVLLELKKLKGQEKAKAEAALANADTPVSHVLRAGMAEDDKVKLEQLDAALKAKSDFIPALRMRGSLRSKLKQDVAALADFDRLIRLAPKDVDAYRGRADVYARLERLEEAGLDWDEAVDLDGEDAITLNGRCWFLGTHNMDLEKALGDCDAALRMSRDDYESGNMLDSRGLVNLRLKRLNQALKDYDDALAQRPTRAESMYGRGLVKAAMGDTAGSAKDIAEALRFDPEVGKEFATYGLKP